MKKGTEESDIEDLANRDGPVHALATPEGVAKRWIRGARRPAMQPRNRQFRGADVLWISGRQHGGGVFAIRRQTPRGRRTRACACVISLMMAAPTRAPVTARIEPHREARPAHGEICGLLGLRQASHVFLVPRIFGATRYGSRSRCPFAPRADRACYGPQRCSPHSVACSAITRVGPAERNFNLCGGRRLAAAALKCGPMVEV
jgi:hypothetical protein